MNIASSSASSPSSSLSAAASSSSSCASGPLSADFSQHPRAPLPHPSHILSTGVSGIPSDALAQILSVPSSRPLPPSSSSSSSSFPTASSSHPDLHHGDGGATITPNISFPISDFFHHAQPFKGFHHENVFPHINSAPNGRIEEGDAARNSIPFSAPMDYTRYLRWTGDEGQKPGVQPNQTREVPPLALSPAGATLALAGNSAAAAASINAQDLMFDDDSRSDTDISPRGDIKTPDGMQGDDKAQKKKRRQEKNREAAQLFRQRQKAKVHELERSVNELTCNNSEYRMKMEILAFENKILKDQLIYLKNLVASGIVITSPPSTAFPSLPVAPDPEKAEAALAAAIGGVGPNNSLPLINANGVPHAGMPVPIPLHVLGGAPMNNISSPLRPSAVPMLTPKSIVPVPGMHVSVSPPPPSSILHAPTMEDTYIAHL